MEVGEGGKAQSRPRRRRGEGSYRALKREATSRSELGRPDPARSGKTTGRSDLGLVTRGGDVLGLSGSVAGSFLGLAGGVASGFLGLAGGVAGSVLGLLVASGHVVDGVLRVN